MKHKTWFRLVLKAIGILLIGFAIPGLVRDLANYFLWMYLMGGNIALPPTIPGEIQRVVLQGLPHLVQLALGLYFLLGGTWLLNKIIPSNKPYCPECGYDLSESASDKCAECGVTFPRREA